MRCMRTCYIVNVFGHAFELSIDTHGQSTIHQQKRYCVLYQVLQHTHIKSHTYMKCSDNQNIIEWRIAD